MNGIATQSPRGEGNYTVLGDGWPPTPAVGGRAKSPGFPLKTCGNDELWQSCQDILTAAIFTEATRILCNDGGAPAKNHDDRSSRYAGV